MVWEKGGSGLVFYTDASHWDQLDGGGLDHTVNHLDISITILFPADFDEKCSQEDDWDVDMSLYYNYGANNNNYYEC